ncbi:uncharacterized protein LOC117175364 [Belonocnema kinseyi]|uniref:uncharacterized protein LOC117175364 n=1 Tax=Belonocnema kinseyi TaxID=2817044 RepID=UPI00143D5312|nr:uncharacterized protein LOC117175364 [Belonocnema kinseyi]
MVISNTNLSAVWKLNYLKQSLKGTAAHLLKNTALTTDKFQNAWNSLVFFYKNKRLLVNTALHSLLNMKRMTKESATELESLYTAITQIYRTLEILGRPVHTWDDVLVFIAVQRSSKEPPTWKQISEFMMIRLLTLQAVEKSRRPGFQSNQPSVKAHVVSGLQASSNSSKCGFCSSDHYAVHCLEYVNQSVQRRLEIISKKNLCFNCLGLHPASACRYTRRCNKCGKKHHSSIHKGSSTDEHESSTSDSNVQVNRAAVKGVGAVNAGQTRGSVTVTLTPHFKFSSECIITAHVLRQLTESFSFVDTSNLNWSHLKGLQFADAHFQSPGHVDVIIGSVSLFRSSKKVFVKAHLILQPHKPQFSDGYFLADQKPVHLHLKFKAITYLSMKNLARLPLKKSAGHLGDSKTTALRMLSRLLNKLQADPAIQKTYSNFLNEYEVLDHIKLVPVSIPESPQCHFYIPHHGVIHASSLTTKLRVVSQAQESVPKEKWHCIPGKENPADCSTRGLTPSQLSQHQIWWTGPYWLQEPSLSWPNRFEAPFVDTNLQERPVQSTSVTVSTAST